MAWPPTTHQDVQDAVQALRDTGGAFLSGSGAPASGSGLQPLDGVNDPWRWFAPMGGWVGPAYEVTWQAGDEVGFLPTMPEANEEYALWIGSVTTPTEANNNTPGQFYVRDLDGTLTDAPASNIFQGRLPFGGSTQFTNGPGVAIADGSGIAFLFQAERYFAGPTAVPDPTFDAGLTNLTTVLGSDVVIGAPYEWSEVGVGNDGDTYRDTSAPAGTLKLYGPKAGGVWPAPQTFVSDNAETVPILTSPDGTAFRLTVANDGTVTSTPV